MLQPNPINTAELNETLGLVDLMLPDQVSEIQAQFAEVVDKYGIFDNLKPTKESPGKKFIIVSNHLQLPDQGFTMGFFHKVAAEHGIDRLEHYSTAVIGRDIAATGTLLRGEAEAKHQQIARYKVPIIYE